MKSYRINKEKKIRWAGYSNVVDETFFGGGILPSYFSFLSISDRKGFSANFHW
jgi:hypothetical protein